jgi:pimeloyl-ACP methyl ester carboxylesterase
MHIIDRGSGPPLVLVPGIQGRWEYAQPAIDELARSFRVITFPLCDEPASGCRRETSLDAFARHIESVLDQVRIDKAIICGVSFGGVIALRFSTLRPNRVLALVLASTPGPDWRLNRRQRIYSRAPRLFGPAFLAETPGRVRAELRQALPSAVERRRFAWRQLRALATAPLSFSRMAARARLIDGASIARDCSLLAAPTLVITGQPALDHIVPSDGSAAYASLIRHATLTRLAGTGHLGYITKPSVFAAAVSRFAGDVVSQSPQTGIRTRNDAA